MPDKASSEKGVVDKRESERRSGETPIGLGNRRSPQDQTFMISSLPLGASPLYHFQRCPQIMTSLVGQYIHEVKISYSYCFSSYYFYTLLY